MRKTSTVPIPFILPLVLLSVVAFAGSWMATTALADEHENGNGESGTIVVRNGDGEPGYTINAFLPQEITIRTGTTVRWEFPFGEPHSTTYGEPGPPTASGSEFDGTSPVNSNVIFGGDGQSWDLVFTAEGEFEFYCLIHSFQTMTVTVTDDEEVDVDTQADVDARGEAYFDDAMARIKAVADDLRAAPVQSEELEDGTTLWTIINGAATEDGHDALLYFPSPFTITEGDTIRWVNDVPVPHTVSFGPPPEFTDPFEVAPSLPGDAYDGGPDFWHSGTMFGIPGAIPDTIQTFELTFGAAGTFDYYCLFHAPIGHLGQVTVEEADEPDPTPTEPAATATPVPPTATPTLVAPGPPATGTGATGGPSGQSLALLGGLVALAGLSVLAFRATRNGARQE